MRLLLYGVFLSSPSDWFQGTCLLLLFGMVRVSVCRTYRLGGIMLIAKRCAFCNNPIPENKMFLVLRDRVYCSWRHYGMWLSIQKKPPQEVLWKSSTTQRLAYTFSLKKRRGKCNSRFRLWMRLQGTWTTHKRRTRLSTPSWLSLKRKTHTPISYFREDLTCPLFYFKLCYTYWLFWCTCYNINMLEINDAMKEAESELEFLNDLLGYVK